MVDMTVEQIRHKNFLAALEEWRVSRAVKRKDDSDRAFAIEYGSDESYINQLKSGKCNIGPRTARKLEKILRKSTGWLDMIDTSLRPDETMLLTMYRSLSDTGKKDAAGYLSYLMTREKDPVKGKITDPSEFYFPPNQ